MGIKFITNFRGGRKLHTPQRDLLGVTKQNKRGDFFGYLRVGEAFNKGQPLRVAKHNDLVATSSNQDHVTAAAAVGTNFLKSTGAFLNKKLRGAFGSIKSGAGAGQTFYVVDVVDKDTIEVFVINDEDGFTDTGAVSSGTWTTALTTGSRFDLQFPGVAFAVDASGDEHEPLEGVGQIAATADDIGKHFWAPRKGPYLAISDGSAIAAHDFIVPTSAGKVQSYAVADVAASVSTVAALRTAVNTIKDAITQDQLAILGRAFTAIDVADGDLIRINLDLPALPYSESLPYLHNPYNEVDIPAAG